MAEIKNMGEGCYIAMNIGDGDVLSAGGSRISQTAEAKILFDFAALDSFFEKARETFKLNDMQQLQTWGQGFNMRIDAALFAALYLTQKISEKHLTARSAKDSFERNRLYGFEATTRLSDVMSSNQMMCLELAAIAYKILSDQDYNVHFVQGARAPHDFNESNEASSDSHSFLVVEGDADNLVIFDPANPIQSNLGEFPSMFCVSKQEFSLLKQQAQAGRTACLRMPEEITGNIRVYGFGIPEIVFLPRCVVRLDPNNPAEELGL